MAEHQARLVAEIPNIGNAQPAVSQAIAPSVDHLYGQSSGKYLVVNGTCFLHGASAVSARDRGLLYGDAVYTTMRVKLGKAGFLLSHLARLRDHSARIGINVSVDSVLTSVELVLDANNFTEGGLRITVTRGESLGASADGPTIVTQVFPLSPPVPHIDVITIPEGRDVLRHIKTTNRMTALRAFYVALERGATEALYYDAAGIVEATCHNVISLQDGRLITPDMKNGRGLQGIIRQALLDGKVVHTGVVDGVIDGPVFLSNSLVGVVPVKHLDGRELRQDQEILDRLRDSVAALANQDGVVA